MEILTTILSGVAVAVLSSWVTVRLSLSRFRTEKWWEKKAETYSNILNALHDTKAFAVEHLEAEIESRELKNEDAERLRLLGKEAEANLARMIDVGSFYLSRAAIERLKQFRVEMRRASDTTDWITYLAGEQKATTSCLYDLIEISHRDLNLKPTSVLHQLRETFRKLWSFVREKSTRGTSATKINE